MGIELYNQYMTEERVDERVFSLKKREKVKEQKTMKKAVYGYCGSKNGFGKLLLSE